MGLNKVQSLIEKYIFEESEKWHSNAKDANQCWQVTLPELITSVTEIGKTYLRFWFLHLTSRK